MVTWLPGGREKDSLGVIENQSPLIWLIFACESEWFVIFLGLWEKKIAHPLFPSILLEFSNPSIITGVLLYFLSEKVLD